MGNEQNIDNVTNEREYNVNDNVREKVLSQVSEYRLEKIQEFLFGGMCGYFGDSKVFVVPAIRQVERFTYIWLNDLDDSTRKAIFRYMLGHEGDTRTRGYSDFTGSPLWVYESSLIKQARGYTCERCKTKYNPAHLVVHHKTYEHLGSELLHPEDVELLCTDCHMDTHGIRRTK